MKTCPVCDSPFPDQHNTCPTDGAPLIESRELVPGHIVRGKYRIVRKLGQGGMGVVYLAEHLLLGGQMALKFLAVELSRNPQFVKRFRNEARAAYHLRHPNIIEVADLDQDEAASLFIAMEYVAGPSLRTVLRQTKGPIPTNRALQIARGVAAGLAAAHARGAVHRDIKPENILLGMEPNGEVQPKVLDFGIAAMTENITGLSHTHGLLLTPEYAAPEQWTGTPANELDGRTDLYALGGVIYEMLAGRTPFRAANAQGWMYQHLQGSPEPLANLRPDLAQHFPGLDALVMRLLAREREQRFDSANAALEALAQFSPANQTAPAAPANGNVIPPHVGPTTVRPQIEESQSEIESLVRENQTPVAPPLSSGQDSRAAETTGKRLVSTIFEPSQTSNRRTLVLFCAGFALVAAVVILIIWFASNHHASQENASNSPMNPASTPAIVPKPESSSPAASPPSTEAASNSRSNVASAGQEDQSGLTWVDRATGLMWTKRSTGGNLNWSQARNYCSSSQLAGYSDWRLPSVDELQTLSGTSEARGGARLGNIQVSEPWVWSDAAAKDANGQTTASVLYIGFGGAGQETVSIANQYCAVCVRRSGALGEAQTRNNAQQDFQQTPATQNGGDGKLQAPEKVNISAGVAVGMLLQKTAPLYPPIARAARISGTVVLKATISKTGSIRDLSVISGPPMLQQAALDAVKTWRYRPFRLNGRPAEAQTTINVVFILGT